jgi:hypothetical protein
LSVEVMKVNLFHLLAVACRAHAAAPDHGFRSLAPL